MTSLTDQGILITGGGSGIGLAAARLLAEAGARVAIAGRDAKKMEQAVADWPPKIRPFRWPADVSDPDQAASLVQKVTKELGRIDILVNNAGTNLKERTMRQLTIEAWQQLIRTNLDGAFYCIHAVLPQMLERRNGLIVNIVSIAGKRASPLSGAGYAAAKFGMSALGLTLAAEEKDNGIRVSNIYPGEVDTPILEVRPTPVTADQRAKILKAEDVAQAVLFVCTLPPHVSVPELIIKPTSQLYV
jgi:NADP-dependent 3-hydroxy acid dehydrogenase YdfG